MQLHSVIYNLCYKGVYDECRMLSMKLNYLLASIINNMYDSEAKTFLFMQVDQFFDGKNLRNIIQFRGLLQNMMVDTKLS